MKKYLIDTKLSTKALLATIIPFSVNVALLIVMWVNSSQIQLLSFKEKQLGNFVEEINEFAQQYYLLQGDFTSAFVSLNEHQLANFNMSEERFLTRLKGIYANPILQDSQRTYIDHLAEFAAAQKDILKDAYSNPDEDRWHRFVLFRRTVLAKLRNAADDKRDVKEFSQPQRLELDRLRQNLDQRQQIFLPLLIAGVSINLAIAILMHFLYGRYITSRIETLVSNAKALSKRSTLLEPMSGRDDFAIVDEALHDSARQIEAAFNQKQALMQMIAHDLKSPLSASQLSLETLLAREQNLLSESSLKTINRVNGNNKRLLSLVNDLLTIDALELGRLDLSVEPAQIEKCVREAIETLSAIAVSKNISINVKVDDHVGLFDYRRILQVLINLLSNAIKFSNNNSSMIITSNRTVDGKLKVSIIDKGKGISKKDQRKLFQKYYQTAEGKAASGSGLGLAISKLIVDAHQEKIGVESEENKGATFWFTVADGEAD